MKKLVLYTVFVVFALTTNAAKKVEGFILYDNNQSVKVVFLIPSGFLNSEPAYQKLQYRVSYIQNNVKLTLKPDDAKEISFTYNGQTIRMLSVVDNLQMGSPFSSKVKVFLKLVVDGEIKLFDYYATSYSPGIYNPGTGMMGGGSSYTYERLVMQRGDGPLVRPRDFYFKKDMTEFLQDCPKLVERINEKVFKKSDLELIVREYNAKCVKQ
jgi:hypothetical protein